MTSCRTPGAIGAQLGVGFDARPQAETRGKKSIGTVRDAPPASPTLGGIVPFVGGALAWSGGAASTTGERAAAVATGVLAAEVMVGAEAGASDDERAHPAEIAARSRRYRIMSKPIRSW